MGKEIPRLRGPTGSQKRTGKETFGPLRSE